MATVSAVIEERGADWDVRQDYAILGQEEDLVGRFFRARDRRTSGLPVSLQSIELTPEHSAEIISNFALLRDASLSCAFLTQVYRLVLHRRGDSRPQLILALSPPQYGTLESLVKQWAKDPTNAPGTMDDTHVLHTAISLLEALRTLEESGFMHRLVRPSSIAIASKAPWTFLVPQLIDFEVPGQDTKNTNSFMPAFARAVDRDSLSTEDRCHVDLYGLGAVLYMLRTLALWSDAETSDGLSNAAVLELNKARVSDPLRELLYGLMGAQGNAPTYKTFDEALEAAQEAYWKVAAEKGRANSPATNEGEGSSEPTAPNIGLQSLSLLEQREDWNHAPEVTLKAVLDEVDKQLGDDYKYLRLEDYSCGGTTNRIGVFEHVQTGMEMCLVPGGLYTRGSASASAERAWAEKQKCSVTDDVLNDETPSDQILIQPLLVGRTPVQIRHWELMDGKGKSKDKTQMPKVEVTMADVRKRLSTAAGGLRLPSESEWEYFCRAGTKSRFYWGDDFDPAYCWFAGNTDGEVQDSAAHADKANSFGLVDTLGNILEWCEDHYVARHIGAPKDQSPRLFDDEDHPRVVRGGCVWYNEAYCRSAARASCRSPKKVGRNHVGPPPAFASLGWRAVRSLS